MPVKSQAKSSKPRAQPRDPAAEPGAIRQALQVFQPVRGVALRWVIRLAPWLLVLYGILLVKIDLMFATGAWTAAIALWLFQFLMGLIPETFRTLWDRGVISGQFADPGGDPRFSAQAGFRHFIHSFERLLNGRGQFISALVLGVLGGGWVLFGAVIRLVESGKSLPLALSIIGNYLSSHFLSFVLGQRFWLYFLVGAILGLLVWRMVVTSYEIWQLGRRFDLVPQFGHPDGCAGFAPLGYLCLWNALISSVAATYLGVWIMLLGSGIKVGYSVSYYVPLFSAYLLVPVSYAFVSFFLPVWNVHEIMRTKRELIREKLDQLGRSINRLAREMLEQAEKRSSEDNQEAARRLEIMRQTYEANKRIPAWPFNVQIWARFIGSMVVPVLGLTQIGQPVLNAIGALVKWLNPTP